MRTEPCLLRLPCKLYERHRPGCERHWDTTSAPARGACGDLSVEPDSGTPSGVP